MVIGEYQRKSSRFVGRGRVAVGGGSRSIDRGERQVAKKVAMRKELIVVDEVMVRGVSDGGCSGGAFG